MMHRWFKTRKAIIVVPLLLALSFIIACGGSATAVPPTAVPAVKEAPAATAVPAVKEAPAATAVPRAKATPAGIAPNPAAKYGGVIKTNSGTPGTWDVNQSPSSSVLSPVGPRLQGLMKMSPYDRGVTILPGLAHSWEVSDDGLLFTFHLRDAKFHDGSKVTPDDVVASWTRIHAPKADEISYRKDWFSRIEEVKAVDQSTVQIVFREPSANIISFIASDWNAIFPEKMLAENNYDLKTVIDHPSAGPFKFLELKAGELISYEKFDDYWDEGFPYLDGVEFHLLGSGAFAAFLVGQLDTQQVSNPVDFQLALDRGVEGERAVVPIVHAIYFNFKVKPFDDIRVRRAMDLVIDREAWGIVTANVTIPHEGRWAPPGGFFAEPDARLMALPAYNPDKEAKLAQAKALMAEAGYADGFEAVMTAGSPSSIAIHGEFVQSVWNETLNIDLSLEVLDWSVWIARAKETQFALTSGAAFTTLHDPSDFMNVFWRTGGAQNWAGWSNSEFDSIMDKVDTELDADKRKELVFMAYDVLEREMPQMTGGWSVDGHMWWPYVKGFPSRGPEMGRYVFYDRQTLWLDK